MARFSDLPNELIISFYALSNDFRDEHNALKARFSSIVHRKRDIKNRPADTLRELLLNPRAALYVRDVLIDDWHGRFDSLSRAGDYWIPEGSRHRMYSDEMMGLFTEAIRKSPFISQREVEGWIDDLEIGNEDEIYSLILMLLLNLQALNLFRMGPDSRLSNTLRRVGESQDTNALSRLREVQLQGGYDTVSGDVDWVHKLAVLPSLKAINARGIGHSRDCDDYDAYPFNDDVCPCCFGYHDDDHQSSPDLFTLPAKTSAVTHLTFNNCAINTKRLFGFLEELRALESFNYLGASSSMESYEPQEIVSALLANAKHSLQVLRLTTCDENTNCTINLADFEVLKEVEIQSDLLLSSGNEPGESKLVDLLPRSIEKIYFRRLKKDVFHSVESDFTKMATHKAERLPNLKALTIELRRRDEADNADLISKAKLRCAEFGVLLERYVRPYPACEDW